MSREVPTRYISAAANALNLLPEVLAHIVRQGAPTGGADSVKDVAFWVVVYLVVSHLLAFLQALASYAAGFVVLYHLYNKIVVFK
jgi:hypothetical protein